MEFFRTLRKAIGASDLVREITVAHLPNYCREIDKVLRDHGEQGEIYCLWGQFQVHRERINGGVRFTLPDCPNALAWTVTSGLPPDPVATVIHCTINRREHEPEFVDSIELFMDALAEGVSSIANESAAGRGE